MVGGTNLNLSKVISSNEARLKKLEIAPCYRVLMINDFFELDNELIRNKYEVLYSGSVYGIKIANMERELFRFANLYEDGIYFDEKIKKTWFEDYVNVKSFSREYADLFSRNIKNSVEEFVTFALIDREQLLAMAYATIMGRCMVINDIFVLERYRRLGYGKKMLKAMLSKGLQKKCEIVICDVTKDMQESIKMLQSESFDLLYNYKYRGRQL